MIFATVVILILGLFFSLGAALLLRRNPQLAFALWLSVMCFVPYWLSIPVGPFVPVSTIVTAVVALSSYRPARIKAGFPEILVLLLALVVLLEGLFSGADLQNVAVVLSQWVLSFFLGRSLVMTVGIERIARMLAIVAAIVAIAAMIELALNWHPFEAIRQDTFAYDSWAWIQYRGGVARSEWAFGHSISLGNILAIAIPFTLYCAFRTRTKTVLVILLMGGVATTLSRNAMVAACLALVLSLLFLNKEKVGSSLRVGVLAGMAITLAALTPWLLEVLNEARGELSSSSGYRLLMLSLLPTINFFSSSGTYVRLFDGQMGYLSDAYPGGAARSIDNTFVLLGLNHGWVAVALVVVLLLWVVTRRGDSNPARLAVLSQLPTLMTVAMITQFTSFFWLAVGISAATHRVRREAALDANHVAEATAVAVKA